MADKPRISVGMENDRVYIRFHDPDGLFTTMSMDPREAKRVGSRLVNVASIVLEEEK